MTQNEVLAKQFCVLSSVPLHITRLRFTAVTYWISQFSCQNNNPAEAPGSNTDLTEKYDCTLIL